jgi:hypothetical protein
MLNNLTNFFNLITGRRIKTVLEPSDLIAVGTRQSKALGDYKPTAIQFSDLQAQLGGGGGGITLTTVGTTGASTLVGNTLNIPNYATGGGGGLEGTNYVYVTANGTDIENAAELVAAYNESITRVPSITNRITIIAAPGYYNFGSTNFTMNTEYIDLVSLDGNRSVIFNSTDVSGTINITANDVFVKGVNVLTKIFNISSNLSLLKLENCEGGDLSFAGGILLSASGTFINCKGGNSSFGNFASGTFIDCIGGLGSFGTNASPGGSASGTFTNCTGGGSAFGGAPKSTLTGKLYYCRLTAGTFKTVSGGGITRLCLDGNNVENNQG